MRVLLVTSSYLPRAGGLENITSQLTQGFKALGHDIHVLTQRYPRTLSARETIHGVSVERWHFILPRLHYLRAGRWDLFLSGLASFPLTFVSLLLWIVWRRPDVVNLHFVGAPSLFVTLARALISFPYIVSVHGNDVQGIVHGAKFDRWVFRFTLSLADGVTAPSQYLLDCAESIVPGIAHKANVIHNGVQVKRIKPANGGGENGGQMQSWSAWLDSGFIVSVGRLVQVKAFDVLLKALLECKRSGIEIRLVLIGDGPERGALESLGRELNVDGQVVFTGAISHVRVFEIIKASRFVVVPSREESFSLVALEGMACGKAVIATRCGGIPEVVRDDETGRLVPVGDARGLAQALIELWRDPEQSEKLGRRGQQIAEQEFSMEVCLNGYLQVYTAHSNLKHGSGQRA